VLASAGVIGLILAVALAANHNPHLLTWMGR